jgi:hypothetical protein
MTKVDIEGYEYFAFKGAKELLTKETASEILFEFVDWAEENAKIAKGSAQDLLKEYSYSIYEIKKDGAICAEVNTLREGSAMLIASKK